MNKFFSKLKRNSPIQVYHIEFPIFVPIVEVLNHQTHLGCMQSPRKCSIDWGSLVIITCSEFHLENKLRISYSIHVITDHHT